MKPSRLVPGFVLAAALSLGSAAALETDQYLAWPAEVDDSAEAINGFINQQLEEILERLARRAPGIACEDIPPRLFRRLFPNLLHSRLRTFLTTSAEVDRFPGPEVGYWRYLRSSIFRKPAFPFILPMARTIRIGEVRLGIDKVSHMFGFGRRSYARYRRHLRAGRDGDEAMRRIVLWNLRLEWFAIGGLVDGVVSLADVEAAFQGLLLARDLCEADPPFLARDGTSWRLVRPVDLRDYVNPRFDESYYPSLFTHGRWKKVRDVLREEHCPRYGSAEVRAMMSRYGEIDRPSFAVDVISERFEEKDAGRLAEQSLGRLCLGETRQ